MDVNDNKTVESITVDFASREGRVDVNQPIPPYIEGAGFASREGRVDVNLQPLSIRMRSIVRAPSGRVDVNRVNLERMLQLDVAPPVGRVDVNNPASMVSRSIIIVAPSRGATILPPAPGPRRADQGGSFFILVGGGGRVSLS